MWQIGGCVILLYSNTAANSHLHVTATFELTYDLSHDSTGMGVLNVLGGVLPK